MHEREFQWWSTTGTFLYSWYYEDDKKMICKYLQHDRWRDHDCQKWHQFFATRAVLKIGEYPRIFPKFSWGIFAHVTRLDHRLDHRARENIWWIITIAYIWRDNMLGYLSADIICCEQRTVFRERSSRKTVSYEEQIMSKDKYPNIFSPQMEAIVVIILQIFSATRADFKIGEYPRIFPSFSWGIFAHVTRLDQSRASENIWWIIMIDIYRAAKSPTLRWIVLVCTKTVR